MAHNIDFRLVIKYIFIAVLLIPNWAFGSDDVNQILSKDMTPYLTTDNDHKIVTPINNTDIYDNQNSTDKSVNTVDPNNIKDKLQKIRDSFVGEETNNSEQVLDSNKNVIELDINKQITLKDAIVMQPSVLYRYNGYDIKLSKTMMQVEDSTFNKSELVLRKDSNNIYLLNNDEFKGSIAAFLFISINNENLQLVIEDFSGGAHCCTTTVVYDLGRETTKIYESSMSDEQGAVAAFEDINKDGIYEIITQLNNFDYFPNDHALSPFPIVVLEYSDKQKAYIPTSLKHKQYIQKEIQRLKSKLTLPPKYNWDEINFPLDNYRKIVLTVLLDYIYSGMEIEGWKWFGKVYNYPDAEYLKHEIKLRLVASKYYRHIYHNSNEMQKLANDGNPVAQVHLGDDANRTTENVEKDYIKAESWYKKAADVKYAGAYYKLADLYSDKNGPLYSNDNAIIYMEKWAEVSKRQDDAATLIDLYGISGNVQNEIKWIKYLSDKNNSSAQSMLADKYSTGNGVAKDYKKAFNLYTMAANNGNIFSQVNLAYAYANGLGVPKDYKQAFVWASMAAGWRYGELPKRELSIFIKQLTAKLDNKELLISKKMLKGQCHKLKTKKPNLSNDACE